MTIDALYERQRALVRHGILKPIEGRGPGSGVEFSANSAATLLIGVAAVNSLSEVDGRIAAFCDAMPHSASETCSFTGQKTFLGALQAILEDARLNSKVRTVSIGLNTSNIFIGYAARDSRKTLKSNFTRLAETDFQGITKTAVIEAYVLQSIRLFLGK
jgi:formylmethanofuran:tetrahydromethanopterin formyltransferase